MSLSAHRPQQLLCSLERDGAPLLELWLVGGRGNATDPLRVELLGDLDQDGVAIVGRALEELIDRHGAHVDVRLDPATTVGAALPALQALQARLSGRLQLEMDLGQPPRSPHRSATDHRPHPMELRSTAMSLTDSTEPTPEATVGQEIRRALEDGTLVLYLRGELDSDNADVLYSRLSEDVRHQSGPVALDMADVTFIDSTILSRLLQLRTDATEAEGVLTVRRPSPMVQRVLEITGLDQVFGVN